MVTKPICGKCTNAARDADMPNVKVRVERFMVGKSADPRDVWPWWAIVSCHGVNRLTFPHWDRHMGADETVIEKMVVFDGEG